MSLTDKLHEGLASHSKTAAAIAVAVAAAAVEEEF
jgi:hypothetical protein